ncbi:MAG: hypothetical protein HWN66_10645 [Candidatus Helarchaeota archaeon]|nr:hypothetical protein [Candidatus Helarchaeota archaeon]
MADSIPKITVQVLEIPTTLVLLDKSYPILLQIQNNGPIAGKFKISYEGKGAVIKSSDLMNKEFSLPPTISETDRIEFIPTQKGLISLNIKVFYLKEVIKEAIRFVDPSSHPTPSGIPSTPSTPIQDTESVFKDTFSPEISDTLDEIFGEPQAIDIEEPSSPTIQSEPQRIVEQIIETFEKEVFSTPIYLNALDKESSGVLKRFANKGDSNILTSETGLPLCVCYFYSEIQNSKWKIRPALIRAACIRMREKFGKFSYYISYPLSREFDEKEIPVIQEAIKTFVLPHSSASTPMLLLNLDIIPELEKPSIIIGYEKSGIYEHVKNLLAKEFGNAIDIFVDDCVFSGGLLYNYLVNWTGSRQVRILNIILSNNFISNIRMFQKLLESLVSLGV